jgi:hypothetical protein
MICICSTLLNARDIISRPVLERYGDGKWMPAVRFSWLIITRSRPFTMKVPPSVISGRSPK